MSSSSSVLPSKSLTYSFPLPYKIDAISQLQPQFSETNIVNGLTFNLGKVNQNTSCNYEQELKNCLRTTFPGRIITLATK